MKRLPHRIYALAMIVMLLVFSTVQVSCAAEKIAFDQTPEGKAAVTLIAAYDVVFRIDPAYQALTAPEQKMNFILTHVEGKVQDAVIDRTKTALLAATKVFAAKQIRLGLLQEQAPLLVGKMLIEDKSLSALWPGVKADIDVKLGVSMKILDGSIKSAEIGWSTYQAWNSGGAEAGLRALSGSVADEVLGALVPGWGTFRLAQGAVIALGEYVMAYAFDTALAGKINTIFPDIQGNPQGFGEWVIDKSPSAIRAKIDNDWELVDYSGMWAGTGTDAGEEKMKQAIADQIIDMRSSLMAKHRTERIAQQEVMSLVDKAESDKKLAESQVIALTAAASTQAAEGLKVFNQFKGTVLVLKKDAVEQMGKEAKEQSEEIAEGQKKRIFQPINMEPALKHLEIALKEYNESPANGYNQALIEFEENAFADEYRSAIHAAALANDESGSLIELPGNLLVFSDGSQAYTKARKALFDAKVAAMRLEAEARLELARTAAHSDMQSLSDRIKAFNAVSKQMAKSLEERIGAQLSAANIYFSRPGDKDFMALAYANLFGSEAGTYLTAISELKEKGTFYDARPGFYLKAWLDMKKAEKKAQQDASLAGVLLGQEKAFFTDRAIAARAILDAFKKKFSEKIRPADSTLVARLGAEQIAGNNWCGSIATFHCFESGDAAVTLFLTGKFNSIQAEPLFMAPEIFDHVAVLNRSYVVQNYNKSLAAIQDAASTLQWYADMDELALAIIGRSTLAAKGLQNFTYTGDEAAESARATQAFMQKDGVWLIAPDATGSSDGTKIYSALQKAWKENGHRIESLQKLVQSYGKGIYYREGGPPIGPATLEGYKCFSKMLSIWEAAESKAKKDLTLFAGEIAAQRKTFQERFKAASDETTTVRRLDKMNALEKDLDRALDLAGSGANRVMLVLKDELSAMKSAARIFITTNENEWKEHLEELAKSGGAAVKRDIEALGQLSPEDVEVRNILNDKLQIQSFYQKFSEAYEAKNDSGLMGCLDDDWSAGDGTTLADVQDYFRNMFSVFDQIQLKMGDLRIEQNGPNAGYLVSYELLITGHIFAENLKHEEKSTVMEIVTVDSTGRIKIARTPQGQFWLVQ
ncbi:MAG: hypothetical protein J0665_19300 [Deltaproteobacteria bacterium]|nr:hypothetical protein [Deltaproteobacteria bacterium]